MGRPSKLTPAQWQEVERRHLVDGESIRSLAREFGVAHNAIFVRIGPKTKSKKAIANQVAQAEIALASLPPIEQISVRQLADEIKSLALSSTQFAHTNMRTAKHLANVAAASAKKIKPGDIVDGSTPALRSVAAAMAVANEASKAGLSVLSITRDAGKSTPHEPPPTDLGRDIKLDVMALFERPVPKPTA
jgi:hypothetical protein